MKLQILDCHDLTAEQIVDYMIELNPDLQSLIKRQKVYVGSTCNIDERLYRHNARENLIFCAQTAHQNVAAKVEELAYESGFNIGEVKWGGNGTNSYSIYVYAYRITPSTIE
jgi:hypothetical protein